MKSGIYLIASPIGNISDISLRAVDVLKNANLIACEDTRVSKKLFNLLGISIEGKNFVALHDFNEEKTSLKIVEAAKNGNVVAYMSDAGSPLISDPGYKLVKCAKENNVYLTTVPGACAVICALQLSGLPSNTFMFCGFVPNKEKSRHDFLDKYSSLDTTLIFYERADRLLKTLNVMASIFSKREIAVAREITKIYEECINGSAEELIQYFGENPPKGEIVILVSPQKDEDINIDFTQELEQELKKNNLKIAVKNIVERYKINRNEVYKKALELKDNGWNFR